ncbi:MAG TPA: hypothetical protein VLL74_02820 [Methanoregula sp.]|nr:hypothetical protein [Methanoregula sp.]
MNGRGPSPFSHGCTTTHPRRGDRCYGTGLRLSTRLRHGDRRLNGCVSLITIDRLRQDPAALTSGTGIRKGDAGW